MKNEQLKRDLKGILANQHIIEIKKGDTGGKSIEVNTREPLAYETYVYYDNEADRDSDFDALMEAIKVEKERIEKIKTNA